MLALPRRKDCPGLLRSKLIYSPEMVLPTHKIVPSFRAILRRVGFSGKIGWLTVGSGSTWITWHWAKPRMLIWELVKPEVESLVSTAVGRQLNGVL